MYKVTIETNHSPTQHPFKAPLLSDLYIQLPKPQPAFKHSPRHYPDINPYADYQYYQPPESPPFFSDKQLSQNSRSDSNSYFGSKTKNSSSAATCRSESEIIMEWVRSLFQKRNLLGTHWEESLTRKRKELLMEAFQCLKEEEGYQSDEYLQTQSRHKPQCFKFNKMVVLGIEKYAEIIGKINRELKRDTFSKILRYLVFKQVNQKQNSTLKQSRQLKGDMSGSRSNQRRLKLSKNSKSYQHLGSPRASRPEEGPRSPRPIRNNNEDYELYERRNVEQVKSNQHLYIRQNEYALSPNQQISPEYSPQIYQAPQSAQSLPMNEYALTPMSPVRKQYIHQERSNNQYLGQSINQAYPQPPSPNIHYQVQPMVRKEDWARTQNHTRPHSHNPFISCSTSKESSHQLSNQREEDNRPVRAASISPNVKLSIMSKDIKKTDNQDRVYDSRMMEQPTRINDYEVYCQQTKAKIHRLGTAQNKKMRQSYQVNAMGNELIPQDIPPSPQTIYNYSTPNSPRPQQPQKIQVAFGPLSPRNNFGRQSYMPVQTQLPRQLRQSVQFSAELPRELRQSAQFGQCVRRGGREKLMVTSARR